MPCIELETRIGAPVERVFDLARSIDAHTVSTGKTKERVVAGRMTGLIEAGETVTWEATHFGVRQRLTAKVTLMDKPCMFEDEMLQGAFAFLRHRHEFEDAGGGTLMKDILCFQAPLGLLGRLAEWMFLKRYMTHFLQDRNHVLKTLAESEDWRRYLDAADHDVT